MLIDLDHLDLKEPLLSLKTQIFLLRKCLE